MNKKFLNALLFGAFIAASTSTFVSCKDYDDDIDYLQTQITANTNAIAQIQALLDQGVVITKVEKNAEGVLLTMSNGTTQQLTNGADGANGKDADVWTIGTDGYWYKNGALTEYKAQGEKGDKGDTGATGAQGEKGDKGDTGATGAQGPAGANGTNGTNGVDGGFYRPNTTTGNFDYVTIVNGKETVTPTELSWKSSTLSAVQTETGVILSGVSGYEGTITLATVADTEALEADIEALIERIQSVVFIPQYCDDENNVIAPVYNFSSAVYGWNYSSDKTNSDISKPNPRVELKFRVQPEEAAALLVNTFAKKDANNYMKLYVEKALETRAADQSVATIEKVAKDSEAGVIIVTAKINVAGVANDAYRPTTLVIGSDLYNTEVDGANKEVSSEDVKLRITTEYFNLKGIEYPASELEDVDDNIDVNASGQWQIPYTDINVTHKPWEMVYVEIEGLPVNVTNWGYNTNLKVWSGSKVTKADGTALVNGKYRVKDNSGTDAWSKFVTAAKTAGFVIDSEGKFTMGKSSGESAVIANVGNTMTLVLMDETFGYQSNGEPNRKYEVTYVITMPDDTDSYDFGNFARVWSTTDGSKAFTAWSNDNKKDAQFSGKAQTIRQFDIKDSKGNAIKAATDAELATALDAAISSDKVTYTITDKNGNTVKDDNKIIPSLTIDVKNKKANLQVDFGAATYYETKNIKAEVTTDYGVVTFTAVANLSYPTDFLTHEPRWTDGRFNVEAGNQVMSYRDGLVGSSLPAGYTNYAKYTSTGAVTYTFEQVAKTYKENSSWYTPSGINIDDKDYLTLTEVPTAGSAKDLTDNVKIKVSVKVDGYDVTSEEFNLNVMYPLESMQITSGEQEIAAATLINNQTVSVIGNVSLNDRYGNKLVENGTFVNRTGTPNTNAGVWGITGLTYSLEKAYTTVSGQEVTTVSVSTTGEVSIIDPNISEDITVKVKVETVGYTYETLVDYFDVTIKKTY